MTTTKRRSSTPTFTAQIETDEERAARIERSNAALAALTEATQRLEQSRKDGSFARLAAWQAKPLPPATQRFVARWPLTGALNLRAKREW